MHMLPVRPKVRGYLTLQMSLKVTDYSVVPCGVVRRNVGLISGCTCVRYWISGRTVMFELFGHESVKFVEVRLTRSPSPPPVADVIV